MYVSLGADHESDAPHRLTWSLLVRMVYRTRTALVIVPDAKQRGLVEDVLAALPLAVTAVPGTYQALALQQTFDLVVLSIDGLDTNDYPFLEVLRRGTPHLRVLLLVPEGRRIDALGFLRAGADAQLPQPFFVDELEGLVKSLLRYEAADALTGLANRPAYEHALPREISRADRDGTTLALGLLDIDHLSTLNSERGYIGADVVIKAFAACLKLSFRRTDVVARWGGDEFVVIATGLPGDEVKAREGVRLAFDPVLDAVRKDPADFTISGGVALFTPDIPQFRTGEREHLTLPQCKKAGEELFELANRCVQQAKRDGRDRIVYADELSD